MERARIFVFPPIEDFGMVAVEAMASGTPVMANRVGGSGESVQDARSAALAPGDHRRMSLARPGGADSHGVHPPVDVAHGAPRHRVGKALVTVVCV